MVSFSCEACGDVLTKKKLDPHRNRCHGATFTCIDCMVHFPGIQYRTHTSCMTEDQKYQGALYKDKSKKQKQNNYPNQYQQHPNQYQTYNFNTHNNGNMAHNAYVEDCGDDREYDWADYEEHSDSDDESTASEPPPEAPTPPSADHEEHVDVFEFLVASGQTPNGSNMNLANQLPPAAPSTSLVRYEPPKEDDYLETAFLEEEGLPKYKEVPEFVTPAPKHERRKSKEGNEKKDKKRKRLHVDTHAADHEMIDAPPVLHTGLTGGLNRMMKPIFPPSPNYSSGDAVEASPASPLKKTKHSKSKHAKHSNSLFGMIAASKTKTKVKSKTSKTKKPKSPTKKAHKEKKAPRLIEYRPHSKDGKEQPGESQVILYKPCADVFLSFVDKGPESEKGCSMKKVLKQFHKERQATASDFQGKSKEEKDLWRSLRLRQNDRGEIVLFSVGA